MKLHLPIALLTAVICSMSFVQGATSGTYYVLDDQILVTEGKVTTVTKPSSVVYNPEKAPDNAQGTYTFSTDENGTVHSSFVGQGSYAAPLSTYYAASLGTYDKYPGAITAMNPWYTNTDDVAHKADSVNYTIGDGEKLTRISYASGAGVRGQVVTGDKTITVKNNAYVTNLAGGQFLADAWNVSNESETPGVTVVQVQKKGETRPTTYAYNASSKDSTTTINVEDGGKVTALVGGLYALSGPSTAVDENGYSPFVTKDAVDINVSGANANVGMMAGALDSSINNDVNITISGGAQVGTIWAGSVANSSTAKLYVQSTCVELDGANVGAVYAGGDGIKTEVKGNATVILKGDNNSFTSISGLGDSDGKVSGERTLVFDTVSDKKITDYLSKSSNFNAIGFQNKGDLDLSSRDYLKNYEALYIGENTTVNSTSSNEFSKIVVRGEGGALTFAKDAMNLKAENLVVKNGGTVSFVPSLASQQVVAADFSAAAAEGRPEVTLASNLELGSGSTLLLNGYVLDLGDNDLTVYAGAEIWTFDSNASATLAMTEEVLSGFIKTTGAVAFYNAEGDDNPVGSVEATVNGLTGTLGYTNGVVTFTAAGGGSTPAVPEPATATLSLLALAGLCARRRRK